uniref:Uncharacterized protein n=1 Tax=Proboscia inermis TaxID=420281 RepID=A0A7S0CBZ5_9STRA
MRPTLDTPLPKLATISKEFHCSRTGSSGSTLRIKNIVSRLQVLGDGYNVSHSGIDEECERELEREVEEEEEVMVEYARRDARTEDDWDYSSILRSRFCKDIATSVHPLAKVIQNFVSNKHVANIEWSDKVYCTKNFVHTIVLNSENDGLDDVLRIPDCFIRFQCGEILLLSDREGALVLPLLLGKRRTEKSSTAMPYFGHHAFETTTYFPFLRVCSCPKHPGKLDAKDSCSLKLFNGDTMYPGNFSQTLKEMLSHRSNETVTSDCSNISMTLASGEPEAFVERRGKKRDYDMSDLERTSEMIACEMDARKITIK